VGLVKLKGRPKYLKGKVALEQPKVGARMSNLSSLILMGEPAIVSEGLEEVDADVNCFVSRSLCSVKKD
jgi:hypothetical protein